MARHKAGSTVGGAAIAWGHWHEAARELPYGGHPKGHTHTIKQSTQNTISGRLQHKGAHYNIGISRQRMQLPFGACLGSILLQLSRGFWYLPGMPLAPCLQACVEAPWGMARKPLATLRQAMPRPLQEAGERQVSALQWDLALCKSPGGKAVGYHKGACWDLWGTVFKAPVGRQGQCQGQCKKARCLAGIG